MSEVVTNQVGGVVRATVPAIMTVLVALGVMKQPVADAITEPAVIIAGSVGTLATAAMVLWSLWKNSSVQTVKTAGTIAPADIKVVVGPNAPEAIKAVAADQSVPGVVRGQV